MLGAQNAQYVWISCGRIVLKQGVSCLLEAQNK